MPRHQASQARVFAPTDYDDDNIPPPLPSSVSARLWAGLSCGRERARVPAESGICNAAAGISGKTPWGMRDCASPENGAVQLVAADWRAPVWRRCVREPYSERVCFSEFDYRSGVGGRRFGLDRPESFPSRNTSALNRRGLF